MVLFGGPDHASVLATVTSMCVGRCHDVVEDLGTDYGIKGESE
jgi:hypothetical protein